MCKAFATYFTREGRGHGRVSGLNVTIQVRLPSIAFPTSCIWAGKGKGRVCVFVLQVESHALFGCDSLLAQATQVGGRRTDQMLEFTRSKGRFFNQIGV